MLLTCGVGEDSWESLGLQGDQICPEYSLEGLMLKLKLQYFGHLMQRVDSLEKTDAGRDWGREEKGMTEDEMAGWHHWLDGRESGWTLGVGDGQGGLACCDSWGRKESDTTEWLNWTDWKRHWKVNMSISLIKLEAILTSPSTLWMAVKLHIGLKKQYISMRRSLILLYHLSPKTALGMEHRVI